MCDAPFREFLALIISDGCSDFPQYLLIDIAYRRAQRSRCIRRIEIEDAHKVFMLKVVVRVKPASAHQAKAKYETEKSALAELEKLRNEMRKQELMEAVIKSDRSYDEILAFIKGTDSED